MTTPLYPLLFHPVYKDYLWGGNRIITRYQREVPLGTCAESWEVSSRTDGMSIIRNGALSGQSLAEALRIWGHQLTGAAAPPDRFPLLIKLIDARETLSIQVHPNDKTALLVNGEAKTECWHILETTPEATVLAGFKPGVTPTAYDEAVRQGTVATLLNRIAVKPGDTIFIPGGMVHAINAGCMLLEVQQNSNTTFRIDDGGRLGPDGKPRELHTGPARIVINWDTTLEPKVIPAPLPSTPGHQQALEIQSPFFRLEHHCQNAGAVTWDGQEKSFVVLFVAKGHLRLHWADGEQSLHEGTTCLIPAGLRNVTSTTDHGARLLVTRLPDATN